MALKTIWLAGARGLLALKDGQTKCTQDFDENRHHPLQPARRPRHDARVVSVQHPPNSTLHTFQCRFRTSLLRQFLKVGATCEYACVLAEPHWGDEEYRSEEDVEQQRRKHASLIKPLCHLEHSEHTMLSFRTQALIPSWSLRNTCIICCGTRKRGSTCQRTVRSTESYAFCRSMKHRNSGSRAFLPNSRSLRTVNIISVVERCWRNPHCSSSSSSFVSH